MPYEEIAHTADVALRVRGADLAELFASAAEGMFWLAGALGRPAAELGCELRVSLHAPDAETLLIAWLNELLWITEGERWLPLEYEFDVLSTTRLEARVVGKSLVSFGKHIKAATYNEVDIVNAGGWLETLLVFDV